MTRITPDRPRHPRGHVETVLVGGPLNESRRSVPIGADGLPPLRLTFIRTEQGRGRRADIAFYTYLRGDIRDAPLGSPWPYAYLDPIPSDPEEENSDA